MLADSQNPHWVSNIGVMTKQVIVSGGSKPPSNLERDTPARATTTLGK